MTKQEVISLIKRNKNTKREAITLISDFLVTTRARAKQIYQEEFENNEISKN